MAENISRRQFFKLNPFDALRSITKKEPDGPVKEKTFYRPPGACSNEDDFLSKCERCHKCADACPHDVIFSLGPIEGKREGTPALDPSGKPCQWCKDMDCINACPSGALSFNDDGGINRIGSVMLNLDDCLNTHGILCDTCVSFCPPSVKALKSDGRAPVLDPEKCVGCGLCVYYCESERVAIKIIKF